MNYKQKKILKQAFLMVEKTKFTFWDWNYSNTNFTVSGNWLWWRLISKSKQVKYHTSLFYLTPIFLLVSMLVTTFAISLFFLEDGMTGSVFSGHLYVCLLYSTSLILPYIGYNLYHWKLIRKLFELNKQKRKLSKDAKKKKAQDFVDSFLEKNVKLERKLKLKELD